MRVLDMELHLNRNKQINKTAHQYQPLSWNNNVTICQMGVCEFWTSRVHSDTNLDHHLELYSSEFFWPQEVKMMVWLMLHVYLLIWEKRETLLLIT